MFSILLSLLLGCAPEPASIKFEGIDAAAGVTVNKLDAIDLAKAQVLDKAGKAIQPAPKIEWKVGPDTVAKLEGGKIVPTAAGEITVDAKVGAAKASYKIVVALPDKVEISGYTAPIAVGGTASLLAAVKAGETAIEGQTVTWATSADAIAKIDEKGTVTAVAPGKATITATSGALTATVEVEIQDPAAVAATPAASGEAAPAAQ